jgi:hypothetical protein
MPLDRAGNMVTMTATDNRFSRSPAGRYRLLKHRAAKEGVRLALTFEQYAALIRPDACHYCGFRLAATGVALDRKIPGGDYTPKNVVPACAECNILKSHLFSYDEMVILGRTVAEIKSARSHQHYPLRGPGRGIHTSPGTLPVSAAKEKNVLVTPVSKGRYLIRRR